MKKIFAILMTICLLAGALSITAFAEEAPVAGTVMRVRRQSGSNEPTFVADYDNFETGWNEAMELADNISDRVIVDLYADWIAASNGDFTDDFFNGAGFKWDTIYFNDEVRMTLNMNGHTINRRCPRGVENGEVIYIDDDADVIINNGTITGGNSYTGAGGIHVIDDAKLTLNNVHIIGNIIDDCDGAGIVLDGAHLIMNGGSFQNNIACGETLNAYGGAIYINDGTATFNGVTFKNNVVKEDNHYGAAIYADESTIVLNECTVDGNGIEDEANNFKAARSIIHAIESSITVKKTIFTNNGSLHYEGNQHYGFKNVSSLFFLSESTLVMENGSSISKNKTGHIIQASDSSAFYISDTTFTDNNSIVLSSSFHKNDSNFYNCTFNNNRVSGYYGIKITFASHTFITENTITFYNCRMGNSTYSNSKLVRLVNEDLESPTVLTLSALKTDGTTVTLEEYRSFEEGWSTAMSLANDDYWMRIENMYQAIVVDLHADWVATNGRFTQDLLNGIGFGGDALEIPEGSTLILNMNGHKIDRGISKPQDDGEVIYIMPSAKVTINNGTITGGWSNNGAGGIHIKDNATVVLNNVKVDGNAVTGDEGAAIAVYDGATLVMKGGSISNNKINVGVFDNLSNGAIYVNDSTVSLTEVTFSNNTTDCVDTEGVAIYADESTVTIDKCSFVGNAVMSGKNKSACSVIYASDCEITVTNSNFENNASKPTSEYDYAYLFKLEDSSMTMEGGKFTGNNSTLLFYTDESEATIKGVSITGNASAVIGVYNDTKKVNMSQCTLENNTPADDAAEIRVAERGTLIMTDCTFDKDTKFADKSMVMFSEKAVGSIFGEGSLTNILVIISLIASGVSIFLTVYYNKKKAAPVAADNKEAEDEE